MNEHLRAQFPILKKLIHGKPLIYFDSAATAQKPQVVIDAICNFYTDSYGTVHRSIYSLASCATIHYNRVRVQVKQFLNAAFEEEIIFTKGTTEGINLVASSFGKAFIQPGDEILISTMEHHSNIVPWQILAQEKGAILKIIPINDRGELIFEDYSCLLTKKTKIVSIAHIANSTGTINPIAQIIKEAHAVGAYVLIDGAQSASHMPIDVQQLDADFYLFSGHKSYGPTGIGILYGKKHLLERMPPYQTGGDMIAQVTLQSSTYQLPPLKFESGTPPIAEVIGLGEALIFIESIGRNTIAAWEEELLLCATKALLEIPGVQIMGTATNKGAIISFTIEGLHPLDIGTLLDARGIAIRTGHLCAQPTLQHFGHSAVCRISFGVYNTHEEIALFIESLKDVIRILKREL